MGKSQSTHSLPAADCRPATVVLVGFMGSGKSVVARILASRLGGEVIDLDELIVARAGCSIAQLFAAQGEEAFRQIETEVLREALQNASTRQVIATGGGLVTRNENRALLKDEAARGVLVVYLKADPSVLATRIRRQPGLRPLIDGARVLDLEETRARVQELLQRRAPFYEEVAGLVVPSGASAPAEVAREIERRLSEESRIKVN